MGKKLTTSFSIKDKVQDLNLIRRKLKLHASYKKR